MHGRSCRTTRAVHRCRERGAAAECLKLPVIYRDFKSEKETGGHPDFFYLGAAVPNPVTIPGVQAPTGTQTVMFNKRYCVPNSGGPAKQNDSTDRCWDLAQATLGANGKPVFNMTRTGGTNCATASSPTGATTPTAATFRATRWRGARPSA